MAWKSSSFSRSATSGAFVSTAPKTAADSHKLAMEKVVENARQLARDRNATLKRITDPKLRESASK